MGSNNNGITNRSYNYAIAFFAIAYFTDVTSADTTKTYGMLKHEIVFNKENITEAEIDKIANGLTQTVFFDDALKKSVYVKKEKGMYQIAIPCDISVENSKEAISIFTKLQKDMQALFPNNKIVLNLVVDSVDNVVKRIE